LVDQGRMPAPGSVTYKFITRNGRRFGPYRYRRFYRAGKLEDTYEGKATQDEYDAYIVLKAVRAGEETVMPSSEVSEEDGPTGSPDDPTQSLSPE
jgi:hypothetical protein